jgi:hypothetical protein
MYFKHMTEMPVLPEDLKKDLVEEAIIIFEREQNNRVLHHRRFELENQNSLNYLKDEDMNFYNQSGGVSYLHMSPYLDNRVKQFFKQTNLINIFDYYGLLFVEGGPYCAPHIDDISRRKNGFQLLLKSGGDNVTTVWWEPKDEFKDLPIIDYSCIPYSKIYKVDENCLEENSWYWLKFDSIHSVENQQSIRIFLVGNKDNTGDYSYMLNNL